MQADKKPLRTVAVLNQKGGSGKTTTAVNVAACLAEQRQRVVLAREADTYVFSSVVADSDQVKTSDRYWRDLAYRVWRRNAEKDLVTFGFDNMDRLIGLIRQPVETIDDEELLLYIAVLAAECDRFEYVVTGADLY